MNIAQICAEKAKAFPRKIAVVHRDVALDFETLDLLVERCAGGLSKLGIEAGNKIALLLEKTPELVISFVACAKLGAMVVPLNYQARPAAISRILSEYDIDALIVAAKFLKLLSDTPRDHKALSKLVACGESDEDMAVKALGWGKLIDEGQEELEPVDVDDDAPFYLNFTSGTTGVPKAAVTTHANLFWNTIASVETLGLRHTDVHLCMFPAYLHPHEIFYRGLYLGGTSVLENSLFPKAVARAISEHGVTCMMGASTLYERLLPFAGNPQFDYSSLRIAESGGMITRETLNKNFEAAFGIPITPVWGSTETTGIAAAPHAGQVRRGGSVGKAALHYSIKVLREDGSDAGDMELGEMFVTGKGVASGYYLPADETGGSLKNGWLETGDLVKRDEDGFIYFVDRKDSMMKVAGMKVFPTVVERVLKEHPAVEDVCVIPVEDDLRGQVPKALVVTRPGMVADVDDLRAFCALRLAAHEIPKVLEFREYIPRSPAGKVLREAALSLSRKDAIRADIDDLRAQTDRIDVQIVKLLNERARSLLGIREQLEAKRERVFSPMREEEVIRNVLGHNSGPAHDGTIEEIFRSILSAFKKM